MRYVDLRPGRSKDIIVANALALMRAGVPKWQALAEALNVAGYRPPKVARTDDCVLWRLAAPSGQHVVCHAVAGDEGFAIIVERGNELLLAEMVADLDAATARADVVRRALLSAGLRDDTA